MVTEFVQVQFLTISESESQALESLSRFQMRVLFGQMHQVRVLDCLESGMEDFDSDGESEDEDLDLDRESEDEEEGYDGSEYTGESHNNSDYSDDEFYNGSDDEYKGASNVKSKVRIRSQGGVKSPDAIKSPAAIETQVDNGVGKCNIINKLIPILIASRVYGPGG
jgi:hypothetical protein